MQSLSSLMLRKRYMFVSICRACCCKAVSVLQMLRCCLSVLLISQLLCQAASHSGSQGSPVARADTIFDLLAYGRHHRHSKSKGSICEETEWRKKSLKLIKEVPFAGIFRDLQGESKFEASGLVHVNDTYFAVFDRCIHAMRSLVRLRLLFTKLYSNICWS